MSGRTGKLTAEALEARGPRMVLGEARFEDDSHYLIYREDMVPLRPGNYRLFEWSRSFSLGYLLRIVRAWNTFNVLR